MVWLLLAALVILPHFCVRAGQELDPIQVTLPAEGAVILSKTDDAENPVPGAEFLLQMKTYVTGDGTLPDGMKTEIRDGGS